MRIVRVLSFFLGRNGASDRPDPPERPVEVAPRKWLPVIDTDSCTGCGRCIAACDHACLVMVWEFATLERPHDCGSEGLCVQACREELIRMAWGSARGDHQVGLWEEREEREEPSPSKNGAGPE